MKNGPQISVAALRDKFASGKANNAKGAPLQHNTDSDAALALSNNRRAILQFLDMKGTVSDDQKRIDEDASLALALQLQAEEEALVRPAPRSF